MTSYDLLHKVVKTKQDYKFMVFPERDAAYFHVGSGKVVNDYRKHSIVKNFVSQITPEFGTDNSLLKAEANSTNHRFSEITSGESCQCSSAVWCKYALGGHPDINVHKDKKSEILDLTLNTFLGLNWNWDGWDAIARRNALSKLLKGARLIARSIMPTSSSGVLTLALLPDGKPTIICQKRHVIAVYVTSTTPRYYYCFDNTIGCVRCSTRNAAKKWLLWAAKMNNEHIRGGTMAKPIYDFHPTWSAVKCLSQEQ